MRRRHVFLLALASWASLGHAQEIRPYADPYGDQFYAALCALADRAVVFAWTDQHPFPNYEVRFRIMEPDGSWRAGETVAFSPGYGGAVVTALSDGGFAVGVTSGSSLFRTYDATGAPRGPQTPFSGAYAHLATVSGGACEAVGDGWDGSQGDVIGLRLAADGSPLGPEFVVNDITAGDQFESAVTSDAAGNLVVIWTWDDLGTGKIEYKSFDVAGLPKRPEVTLINFGNGVCDSVNYAKPSFGVADDFVLVWHGNPCGTPEPDVFGQRFDALGASLGQKFLVNQTTAGIQRLATISRLDGYGLAIGWVDADAMARLYTLDARPITGEFPLNVYTQGGQGAYCFASTGNGGFVAAWDSYSQDGDGDSTYLRRFTQPCSLLVAPGPVTSSQASASSFRPNGGACSTVLAYAGTYGANVGTGNITSPFTDEWLTGPGPSPVYGPHIRAFTPQASPVSKVSFYAYGTLRYGAKPAGADIDTDAWDEILTTPGVGVVFGPHVRAWNFDGVRLTPISKVSFFAYQTLKYGANSAGGDVDGDGYAEILTGPGPGVIFGAQLRAFNCDGSAATSINKINAMIFATQYGVNVSAGDWESDGLGSYGDGFDEIVGGQGPGPSYTASIVGLNYDASFLSQIFQSTPLATFYGAHVASGDADAGDIDEIAIAPGPDPAAPSRVMLEELDPMASLSLLPPDDFVAYPASTYGAHVAVGGVAVILGNVPLTPCPERVSRGRRRGLPTPKSRNHSLF